MSTESPELVKGQGCAARHSVEREEDGHISSLSPSLSTLDRTRPSLALRFPALPSLPPAACGTSAAPPPGSTHSAARSPPPRRPATTTLAPLGRGLLTNRVASSWPAGQSRSAVLRSAGCHGTASARRRCHGNGDAPAGPAPQGPTPQHPPGPGPGQ